MTARRNKICCTIAVTGATAAAAAAAMCFLVVHALFFSFLPYINFYCLALGNFSLFFSLSLLKNSLRYDVRLHLTNFSD